MKIFTFLLWIACIQALYTTLKRFVSRNSEKLFEDIRYLVPFWISSYTVFALILYECGGPFKPGVAVLEALNSPKACPIDGHSRTVKAAKILSIFDRCSFSSIIKVLRRSGIPAALATNILIISFYLVQRSPISFFCLITLFAEKLRLRYSSSYPISLFHPVTLFGGRDYSNIPYVAVLSLYEIIIRCEPFHHLREMNLLSIRLTSSYDNTNVYSVSHFVLSETLFIILFNLSLSYPIILSHPVSLFGGRGHCNIPYAASLGLYRLIIRFKISDNATKTQRYSEKVTSLLYMFPVETHLIISLFLQTQCKNLQSLLTPNGERDVDRTYGWSAADDHLRCNLNEQMTARAAVPVGCRLDMQSETAFAFPSRSILISLSFIWNLDSMRRFVQIHFNTQTIALSSIVLKHILPNKMC